MRARAGGLAGLFAALGAACVGPSGNLGPSAAAPRPPQTRRDDNDVPSPHTSFRGRARDTNCPVPPRVETGYELMKLPLLSKTLYYVHENHPKDVSPRARELLVGALEAVALQGDDVLVERDREARPRWVTVTVSGYQCTLNIESVDAPWSLLSTLKLAAGFVQGHLAPAPTGDPGQRLMKIEIAAANGMLSALDGQSRLLDQETYRELLALMPKRAGPNTAYTGTLRAENTSDAITVNGTRQRAALTRAAQSAKGAYVRIPGFRAGVAAEIQRALAALKNQPQKGFILDLRDNSGGLLDEAVKVADAFIKTGTVGAIAGKQGNKDLAAHDDGSEPAGPLVVLVNRQTASGAELVAAAIKNSGRGVVLGEPTAGAASIRVMFDVPIPGRLPPLVGAPDAAPLGLVMMTGRLLAAQDAEIDGVGVQPDLRLPWPVAEPSRPDDDCLRQFAESLIDQARDPRRATLLSMAKALAPQAMCGRAAPPHP
jgi:Peptidase family S41